MTSRLWPTSVKERVQAKLEGLDELAEQIRTDDKQFFDFVVLVAEENQRAFKYSVREKNHRKTDNTSSREAPEAQVSKRQKFADHKQKKLGTKDSSSKKDHDQKRKFTGKCLKCGIVGHKVKNCFKVKSAEEAKEFLDKHLKERGREYPKLPSLGKTERLKVKLNGKIQAEAILDSAASHTFIPLELVEELGLSLGQWNGGSVSWIAQGVSLPVLGTACVDLQLETDGGGSVIMRRVKALILPGKILDDANLVFVGTTELNSLGIHPLNQLKTSLRKVNDANFEGEEELEGSYVNLNSIVSDGIAAQSIVERSSINNNASSKESRSVSKIK
jgi:hypothetical protein